MWTPPSSPPAWNQAHLGPHISSAPPYHYEQLACAPDYLPTDKLMLWSSFTLAFYGVLQSSEFTSPSAFQFNPLVHLSTTDVSFTSTGCLTLHLKASKTDPYRQGCSLLIAPSHRSVCAVRALRKYLALRLTSGTSALFIFQSGNYLTRTKATTIICTLLQRLGISSELYASHSFRIGAATSAAEAGLPPWLIQTRKEGPATATPSILELRLLFSRRFLVCWLPQTPQDKGYGTHYYNVSLLVFHNCIV